MATVDDYLKLIPPQHADKPKYVEMVRYHAQHAVDAINLLEGLPEKFDLDTAVGQQLDFVGEWIGRSRYLEVPLSAVYFSFDVAGVGFDQGVWFEEWNSQTALTRLPDEEFRLVLYSQIAANHWDGTGPGAYAAMAWLFDHFGYTFLVQDRPDLQVDYALYVPADRFLTAVTYALFTVGELTLKPAGVETHYYLQSVPGAPFFGFDVDNDHVGGFDHGAWGERY